MRALGLLLACLAAPVAAQDSTAAAPNAEPCREALITLIADETVTFDGVPAELSDPCGVLATRLFAEEARAQAVEARARLATGARAIAPRDLQPTDGQSGALGGTVAQSEAVPGVEPVALAGGALTAATANGSGGTFAAFSLNPATFLSSDAPAAALAARARRFDASVLVPVDYGLSDGRPAFVGLRLRYDRTAGARGQQLADSLTAAFGTLLGAYGARRTVIKELLSTATAPLACARALRPPEGDPESDHVEACGEEAAPLNPALEARFAAVSARVRRAVDARYFGADLRLDVGDPTLGGVEGADGIAGGLGLAGGLRLDSIPGAPQLRVRLGGFVARRDGLDNVRGGGGVTAGVEWSRPYGLQTLSASVAVEARWTTGAADDVVPDLTRIDGSFVRLRGSVNVPLGDVYSVSLSGSVGEGGPTISVGGNWQTLLSGLGLGR